MKTKAVKHVKGNFLAKGRRFGIVVSQFNEFLTRQLLDGSVDTLLRHGAVEKNIFVVHVPGAFEIPLAAKRLVQNKKVDAVITLGVVIKGQTRHFDQVVNESAAALSSLSQKSDIPVILGIIPAHSVKHAEQRVGVKQANKGREWALAAIEMTNLMQHPFMRKKSK